jgi:hypothetical protein
MNPRHPTPSRIPPAVPRARGNAGVLLALLALLLPPPARAFTATDASTNAPYAQTGQWNLGDNGGTGFGEWRQVGSAATPNRSLDADGFAIYANAGVGEAAVGRSFADDLALSSGTFSVTATHGSISSFSGFALYAANDAEIFRWGITTAEAADGTYPGFWYAIGAGGQTIYEPIDRIYDPETPVTADYSISWSVFSTGMNIDLSITSDSSPVTRQFSLDNSSAVTSIAALVAGSTQAETLHFDNLSVEGPAVPEPSTVALLLLGTLVLRPRRGK